jgi:DNA polymerase-3 subunit epsilon
MKHLELDGKVLLNKLQEIGAADRDPEDGDVVAAILDVETTGLNHLKDEVIQIAIRCFFVSPSTGEVSGIKRTMTALQQPTEPLPPIITKITGFVDADLEGSSIPWEKVSKVLNRCQFIIAHNAGFDRKWVEHALRNNGLPVPDNAIWGCSMTQVDWTPTVRCSKALEVLCAWHGFYYDSHNAKADVDATLHLLRKNEYMKELLENAVAPDYHVFAANSLREENTILKQGRYRWNPDLVCWWKATNNQAEAERECQWLKDNLSQVEPQYFEIEPKHRFSE